MRANTAYQVPEERPLPGYVPMNRPGLPPVVITWADPAYLAMMRAEIGAARAASDFVVVACHWGLGRDVLGYMTEIAHAAIDAGADMVVGHGPHHFLPAELYRGRPILYGLGSFSFHTGHRGKQHGDWIGLMATLDFQDRRASRLGLDFVRHNDANETVLCPAAAEPDALAELTVASGVLGAAFTEQDGMLSLAL
jgi:poly-gamma-glutamate synthesis protein (capsule biosynthesis protein)